MDFIPLATIIIYFAVVTGVGTAMALPLLDAMVPALTATVKTAAKPVRRLGFVYIPNGAVMPSWQPAGDGTMLAEMPRTLSPLEPFRDQVILPVGLSQKQAEALGDGNGEHSRAGTVWLSGVHPKETEGADVRNGTTADQIAARELGLRVLMIQRPAVPPRTTFARLDDILAWLDHTTDRGV